MRYNHDKHHRRSIRLKGYHYSQAGVYFVTLCISDFQYCLGRMENGRIRLSPVGEITDKYWQEIPHHFNHVELDEYVVMPNHIHGILILNNHNMVGIQNFESLPITQNHQIHRYQHIIPHSISSIIRAFKSAITHWCRGNGFKNFHWQRNYYEHIVRGENELNRIRKYIIAAQAVPFGKNPLKWEIDNENPHKTEPK